MALDVLPAFLSEAGEQLQYHRRPLDGRQSEPNASDAWDDAHPDGAADGCPSGHPDHHPADVDAGRLAGRVPVVRPADACLAPAYSQQEPVAVLAPNTLGAVPSAEQSNAESAVPELDGPAAQFHRASAAVARGQLAAAESSALPPVCSQQELARWARQASPVLRKPRVLPASPLGAESEPQYVALAVAAA
jgi:hypothetical protein